MCPQSLHDPSEALPQFSLRGTEKFLCTVFHSINRNKNTLYSLMRRVGGGGGSIAMLDRVYVLRQIRTMLKFAQLTSDPRFAAFLIDKAIHLRSQVDEFSTVADIGPRAPDVEPEK
jgi:hypothetical protein